MNSKCICMLECSSLWYDKRQTGQSVGKVVMGGTMSSALLLLSCLALAIAVFGGFRISVSILGRFRLLVAAFWSTFFNIHFSSLQSSFYSVWVLLQLIIITKATRTISSHFGKRFGQESSLG